MEKLDIKCKCGAIYTLVKEILPYSECDSIECDYCGKILIKWHGGTNYYVENIKKEDNKVKRIGEK